MRKLLKAGSSHIKRYINRETISYVICGIFTTIVGLGSFAFLIYTGLGTVTANTISTVAAVVFAYTVNKIFVFQSRAWSLRILISEFTKFCGARVVTFFAETLLLIIFVDLIGFNSVLMKGFTSIFVTIANYLLSKKIVFHQKDTSNNGSALKVIDSAKRIFPLRLFKDKQKINMDTDKVKMLLFSVCFILAFGLLHRFAFLQHDDFGYGLVSRGTLHEFFLARVDHYMTSNGRAIVHLLLTAFLAFDVYLWRIVNPLLLFFTLYYAAKCVDPVFVGNKNLFLYLLWVSALFLNMPVQIMRETVLWMAGAFNYIYPMFMLLISYYLFSKGLDRGDKRRWLPVLTFFAGATMEQIAPMLVAILVLRLIAQKVNGQKTTAVYPLAVLTAFVGMLTVMLAPGIIRRVNVHDGAQISLQSFSSTFYNFMTSSVGFLYIQLLSVSVIALLVYLFHKREKRLLKAADITALSGFTLLVLLNLAFISGTLDWSHNYLRFALFMLGYVSIASYTLVSFFLLTKQSAPFALFWAAIIGQAVVALSIHHPYRTFFPSLFVLIIAVIIIWKEIIKGATIASILKPLIMTVFVILCITGMFNYSVILRGYIQNSEVHLHNIEMTNYVRQNAERLRNEGVAFEDLIMPLHDSRFAVSELSGTAWIVTAFMQYYEIFELIDITAEQVEARRNRLIINGYEKSLSNPILYIHGSLYIPLRSTIDVLELTSKSCFFDVQWKDIEQYALVVRNNQVLFIAPVDSFIIYINNEAIELSGITAMRHDRIYMSVDVLTKGFGLAYLIMPNEHGGFSILIQYAAGTVYC